MAVAKKKVAPKAKVAKPKAPAPAPAPAKVKCICRVKCQPRCEDGVIRFFNAGDIFYFVKPPVHFMPITTLGKSEINFNLIAENILRDANAISKDLIAAFIFETYGEQYESHTRKEMVDALMSLRGTDTSSLSSMPSAAKTAAEYKNPANTDNNLGVSFEAEEGVVLSDDDDGLSLGDDDDSDDLDDLLSAKE